MEERKRVKVEEVPGTRRGGHRPTGAAPGAVPPVKRWGWFGRKREVMLQEARSERAIHVLVQGLAHEIRNPLFAIDVNVAALGKCLADNSGAGPFMAHIHDQVRRLDGLMRDLMELGCPIGEEEFVRADLAGLLKESEVLLNEHMPGAAGRVMLDLPAKPVALVCVPRKLTRAFSHLLGNAVQNVPGTSPIAVKVRRANGCLEVTVSDLGDGIPDAILPRLFEPFSTTHQGRTGLGLTLVKHYVHAHGGTVSGKNRRGGKGAVFTVILPERTAEAQPHT